MQSLPLFHEIAGRPVLLVGDGPPADAKARLIVAAGGRVVDTVEPEVRLAFVALTGREAAATAARLRAAGLLVNVVDRPDLCDFTVPAIVDRSPVVVAIGTGGASASLAKALRERLEALLPGGLGQLASAIRDARPRVARSHSTVDERRRFWDGLLAPGGLLDPLAEVDPVVPDTLPGAPPPRLDTIALASDDPDDLSLRQLRWLAQADTVYDESGAPAVLDRARRDAARVAGPPPAILPPGRSVHLRR